MAAAQRRRSSWTRVAGTPHPRAQSTVPASPLRPSAAPLTAVRPPVWSIYGAERAQMAAIRGESDGQQNRSNKPGRGLGLPLVARTTKW